MVVYATDRKYQSTGAQFAVRLASDGPMSFSDYAEVLKDIDSVYGVCVKELTARQRSSNKRKEGFLVVESFKVGSLEIFADPYLTGVTAGVAANAITSLFIYVMRRIKGRPSVDEKLPLEQVDPTLISSESLADAANRAVQYTSKTRKNLHDKTRSFGLTITITVEKKSYVVTES